MNYGKILKWSLVGTLVVGLLLSVYGFINDWPTIEDISTVNDAKISVSDATKAIDIATEDINKAKADIDSAKVDIDEAELAVKEAVGKTKKAEAEKQLAREKDTLSIAESEQKRAEKELKDAKKALPQIEKDIEDAESRMVGVDLVLWGGYILVIITLIAVAFGAVVMRGINNPKSLIKLGIGLVAIVVIILIAYLMASGKLPDGWNGKDVDSGTLMLTDTVLNLAYILVAGSLVALVAGWIIGLTRK